MTDPPPRQPNPGRIFDLYTGISRPQILRLALQLDVRTLLAGGLLDAAAVASACGSSTAGIARILDALAGMQAVTCHGCHYAVTLDAATFLVREQPAYVGDLILAWSGPAL